jgi:hypothetical protein
MFPDWWVPLSSKENQLKWVQRLVSDSQGQNLALIVLHVDASQGFFLHQ